MEIHPDRSRTAISMPCDCRRHRQLKDERPILYSATADRTERDAGLERMPDVPCGMMENGNYAIRQVMECRATQSARTHTEQLSR